MTKRLLAGIAGLCLVFGIVGCGADQVSSDQQDAKQKALEKVAAESPDANKVEH